MSEASVIVSAAFQTASALAVVNPKVAAVVALAPVIAQLLDTVEKMQAAGTLTGAQLQSMFESIGTSIKKTHDEWVAMNVAS